MILHLALFGLLVGAQDTSSLKMAIVVSRHAIKSSPKDYSELLPLEELEAEYGPIDQDFGAASSQLTPHGMLYAKKVGEYMRNTYGAEFFDEDVTCDELIKQWVMWADTDRRDVDTGNAILSSFAPECQDRIVDGWTANNNTFVREILQEGKDQFDGCPWSNEAQTEALVGQNMEQYVSDNFLQNMRALGDVFMCCKPSMCPNLEEGEKCTLDKIGEPWSQAYYSTWKGGLYHAGNLARTLQTQYVNKNKIFRDVPVQDITEWYGMTSAMWMKWKNPVNRNRFGGGLMATILAMLQRPWNMDRFDPNDGEDPKWGKGGVKMPSEAPKMIWMMSHDVNVEFTAQFLQVLLSSPGHPYQDSSVFLGQIVIELHETGGEHFVKVFQMTSDMVQVRELDVKCMHRSQVAVPLCANPMLCRLDEILLLIAHEIQTVGPEGEPCLNPQLVDFVHDIRQANADYEPAPLTADEKKLMKDWFKGTCAYTPPEYVPMTPSKPDEKPSSASTLGLLSALLAATIIPALW